MIVNEGYNKNIGKKSFIYKRRKFNFTEVNFIFYKILDHH